MEVMGKNDGLKINEQIQKLINEQGSSLFLKGGAALDIVKLDGEWYSVNEDENELVSIPSRTAKFHTGRSVDVLDVFDLGEAREFVIEDGDAVPAVEWISDRSEDWHLYVEAPDYNADFWRSPTTLYHGTYDDRLEGIAEDGLEARSETRGMSNKWTGCAVFAHPSKEYVESGYDKIVEIDCESMRDAGFMPEVSNEEPINEVEMLMSIAWVLQVEEYEQYAYDGISSDGIDMETIVISGDIPVEYLSVDGIPLAKPEISPRMKANKLSSPDERDIEIA